MSKEKIKFLTKTIPKEYLILKTCEELSELNTALLQYCNKGSSKVSDKDVIDEIGDVKLRIKLIEGFFGKKEVEKRFDFKLNSLYKKVKSKFYHEAS